MALDEIRLGRAFTGAAGLVQAEANEIGAEHVSEADLRRAVRQHLQLQFGPVIQPERRLSITAWPRVGKADLAVLSADGSADLALEAKWCRDGQLYETLWDIVKLAQAVSEDAAKAAVVVACAPSRDWAENPNAALFTRREWSTGELFEQFRRAWIDLLRGSKARPTQLPERIGLRSLATVPIHVANQPDWELRAVAVEPLGRRTVRFEGDWPEAVEQATGARGEAVEAVDQATEAIEQATDARTREIRELEEGLPDGYLSRQERTV